MPHPQLYKKAKWCLPGMKLKILVPALLALPKWHVWIADNAAIIAVSNYASALANEVNK